MPQRNVGGDVGVSIILNSGSIVGGPSSGAGLGAGSGAGSIAGVEALRGYALIASYLTVVLIVQTVAGQ